MMLYRYGRAKGFSAPWSASIAVITALCTQLLPYSTIFMLHAPSGALLLFAATSNRRAPAGFSRRAYPPRAAAEAPATSGFRPPLIETEQQVSVSPDRPQRRSQPAVPASTAKSTAQASPAQLTRTAARLVRALRQPRHRARLQMSVRRRVHPHLRVERRHIS